MKTILLSDFTTEAASKTKGEQLRKLLEKFLSCKEEIAVDFSGISRFASPFFNNSFASLALIFGFKAIDNIKILNITITGQETYDTSLENARLISKSPEFTEELKRIVSNTPKKVDDKDEM